MVEMKSEGCEWNFLMEALELWLDQEGAYNPNWLTLMQLCDIRGLLLGGLRKNERNELKETEGNNIALMKSLLSELTTIW